MNGFDESVFQAIREGDQVLCRALAGDSRFNPEARDGDGATFLHVAVRSNSPALTALFLDAGCDPDAVDNEGESALHSAAWGGLRDCARMLLSFGAAHSIPRADGKLPIHLAGEESSADTLTDLIDHGADPLARDASGRTVLDTARGLTRAAAEAGAQAREIAGAASGRAFQSVAAASL